DFVVRKRHVPDPRVRPPVDLVASSGILHDDDVALVRSGIRRVQAEVDAAIDGVGRQTGAQDARLINAMMRSRSTVDAIAIELLCRALQADPPTGCRALIACDPYRPVGRDDGIARDAQASNSRELVPRTPVDEHGLVVVVVLRADRSQHPYAAAARVDHERGLAEVDAGLRALPDFLAAGRQSRDADDGLAAAF